VRKICFVVQRYGVEVNGGAEYLCRLYAERLTRFYDVAVLTSCAIDHVSWKNEYAEGLEDINGVKVYRFPTAEERDIQKFASEMGQYFGNPKRDFFDDFCWLSDNGPQCPSLYRFIVENQEQYDVFLFIGYLYYTTTFCMFEVAKKSILISTAHDELPLNECGMFYGMFNMPAAFMYLTEEERCFVQNKFFNARIPCVVTGSGIIPPAQEEIDAQDDIFDKHGLDKQQDYVVYIGRIEEGKSCDLLFESFIEYKNRYGGDVKLVLAGKSIMPIPERDDVVWVGFVSEEEKFALIQHARILVLASHQESLSLVVLEAMKLGVPVIVNANCDVLKGHIDRSNAGLYFYQKADFLETMQLLLSDRALNRTMGENGKKYMKDYYEWADIDQKMIDIIEKVAENGKQ